MPLLTDIGTNKMATKIGRSYNLGYEQHMCVISKTISMFSRMPNLMELCTAVPDDGQSEKPTQNP